MRLVKDEKGIATTEGRVDGPQPLADPISSKEQSAAVLIDRPGHDGRLGRGSKPSPRPGNAASHPNDLQWPLPTDGTKAVRHEPDDLVLRRFKGSLDPPGPIVGLIHEQSAVHDDENPRRSGAVCGRSIGLVGQGDDGDVDGSCLAESGWHIDGLRPAVALEDTFGESHLPVERFDPVNGSEESSEQLDRFTHDRPLENTDQGPRT
jgi:hypothetical protein